MLHQRLADALGDAAMDLAVDDQRVHRAADVVDRDVIDRRAPCRCRDRPRPRRHARRRESSLRHRLVAGRASGPRKSSGKSVRSAAARATSNRPTAWLVPLTAKRPLLNSMSAAAVSRRCSAMRMPFSMMPSEDFLMTIEPSRMPRPEWAPPPTVTRSVSPATKRTHSIGTPSHSVIELREARLVALALRHDADDELDEAVGLHRDLGFLARHAGRDVDIIADADAAIFAALARLGAARLEAGPVAELQRRIHAADIIAAVVFDAERIFVRQLLFRHQVAAAERDAVVAVVRARRDRSAAP